MLCKLDGGVVATDQTNMEHAKLHFTGITADSVKD